MHKIFINNKPMFLLDQKDLNDFKAGRDEWLIEYSTPKELESLIKKFEKDYQLKEIYVYHSDEKELWNKFNSFFNLIETSGGVVKNQIGDMLFIFRNGKWDLPKGKIEKNETTTDAAKREIEEECGIYNLKLIRPLSNTYHVYQQNKKRYLKKGHWFEIYFNGDTKLVPQLEEGITEAKWLNKDQLEMVLSNTYNSIKDVLAEVC